MQDLEVIRTVGTRYNGVVVQDILLRVRGAMVSKTYILDIFRADFWQTLLEKRKVSVVSPQLNR